MTFPPPKSGQPRPRSAKFGRSWQRGGQTCAKLTNFGRVLPTAVHLFGHFGGNIGSSGRIWAAPRLPGKLIDKCWASLGQLLRLPGSSWVTRLGSWRATLPHDLRLSAITGLFRAADITRQGVPWPPSPCWLDGDAEALARAGPRRVRLHRCCAEATSPKLGARDPSAQGCRWDRCGQSAVRSLGRPMAIEHPRLSREGALPPAWGGVVGPARVSRLHDCHFAGRNGPRCVIGCSGGVVAPLL